MKGSQTDFIVNNTEIEMRVVMIDNGAKMT